MPSVDYEAQRAAEQNKPIELYEIHLLNGVVLRFSGETTSKTMDAGPSWMETHSFTTGTFQFYGGPFPNVFFDVEQPLIGSAGGAFPFKMTMASGLFTQYDSGTDYRGGTGSICLSTSNVAGSILLNETPLIPAGTYPTLTNSTGYGWGSPCVRKSIATGETHIMWTGWRSILSHNRAVACCYSHGTAGDMSAPVEPVAQNGGADGNIVGYSNYIGFPTFISYVADEGEEEVIDGITYFKPQYDQTPDEKWMFLCCGRNNVGGAYRSVIYWSGKLGLHSGLTNWTQADNWEQLWGGNYVQYDVAPPSWEHDNYATPSTFRKLGSKYIYFFCSAEVTFPDEFSGIAYNRYDCELETWLYAKPKPLTDLWDGEYTADNAPYGNPQVIFNPLDQKYYMILTYRPWTGTSNTAPSQFLFYSCDDLDAETWTEVVNVPPDLAMGNYTLANTNLFNVYHDSEYEKTFWTFPVKRDAIKQSADDTVNTCSLYFSNVMHHFTSLLSEFDLRMSRVVIKRTFDGLDLDVEGNVVTIFEGVIDEYQLTKDYCKVVCKETLLNWDMTFPKRNYSTVCGFEFKGAACGYDGPETFCDKSQETCTYYSNSNNFGGFNDSAAHQGKHFGTGVTMFGGGSSNRKYDV